MFAPVMTFVAILLFVSLIIVTDANSFNRAFDFIVAIYTVFAVVLIVHFYRLKSKVEYDHDVDTRHFEFKKKGKLENLTWKQKFAGQFVRTEKKNVAEYLTFMGAPSFMAKSLANAEFTQIIEQKADDEDTIKISSIGTPQVDGIFIKAGKSDEETELVEYVDGGKKVKSKLWWDESKKMLCVKFVTPKGWNGYQERYFQDDYTMINKATVTNLDGKTCWFDAVLKRKGY